MMNTFHEQYIFYMNHTRVFYRLNIKSKLPLQ